jgi:hypothetical protein
VQRLEATSVGLAESSHVHTVASGILLFSVVVFLLWCQSSDADVLDELI